MSNPIRSSNPALTGYIDNPYHSQSILDVFVLQDIISVTDAEKLKEHFKTNREVESFLLKNRLVTRETINKAYSILLKLPYISLSHVEIPGKALKMIPEKIAAKYSIIPFSVENNVVRLAISTPSDLLVGYAKGLAKFLEERNISIELFVTGEADFRQAVKQYNSKTKRTLLLKRGSLPVVYLRNQTILDKYLKKLPRDFIARYRIVIFGENSAGGYLAAAEATDSSITRKIIDFLERENNIKIELFSTSKDDIDYVMRLYDGQLIKTRSGQSISRPLATGKEEPKNETDEKITLNGIFDSIFGRKGEPAFTVDERPELSKFIQTEVVETAKPEQGSQTGIMTETKTKTQETADIKPKQDKSGTAGSSDQHSYDEDATDKKVPEKPNEGKIENAQVDTKQATVFPGAKDQSPKKSKDLEEKDLSILLNGEEVADKQVLDRIMKEGYVPRMVAAIINYAVNSRSSDVHIEPGAKLLRIRCRIDGILEEVARLPIEFPPPFASRIKILSKLKIDETRTPQDGRFNIMFKKREVDVRVSFLPTVNGEKIVLRVLDKERGVLSLEDLGMQGSAFQLTVKAIGKPWGIILSTGPTGSGKSTTLYAIISRISVPGINIITLEDPVEYEIPGVNQCQIRPEIGFTFASGLRSVLRQDPNIIMVGEIRDAETASMATHAALTGHLVLSTLHTNDTAGALPRLINMGIEPFLITSSINLVIAQRLVRKICPVCKEEMRVPSGLIEEVKNELRGIAPNNSLDRARIPDELKFYYGKGCKQCSMGFKGRVGIFEVMEIDPKIEELATAKRPANEIKQEALANGMITMKQDGILKALSGVTTIDEVLQATTNN